MVLRSGREYKLVTSAAVLFQVVFVLVLGLANGGVRLPCLKKLTSEKRIVSDNSSQTMNGL
jgi:hypothetical protein